MLRRLRAQTLALEAESGQPIPWVFHRDGKPVGDFQKVWAAACTQAKVSGRVFHDFRRTAVRNMIRLGIPERVATKITGHKTRSVFDRYNIVSEGDLVEAARKIATGTFAGTFDQAHATEARQIMHLNMRHFGLTDHYRYAKKLGRLS